MNNLAGAARLLGDFLQRRTQLLAVETGQVHLLQAAGRIGGNDRQRLVDLVRQRRRHLAHGDQPRGALQLLGVLAFALGQPLGLSDVGINAEPCRLAIDPFDTSAVNLVHARRPRESQLAIDHVLVVARVARPRQYHAERGILLGPNHVFLEGAVGEQQLPVDAAADAHRRIQPVEHRRQPFLRRGHRHPLALVFGDVIEARQPAGLPAALVHQRRQIQPHVETSAIAPLEQQLEAQAGDAVLGDAGQHLVQVSLAVGRPEGIRRRLADQHLGRHAKHVAQRAVDAGDAATEVDRDQAVFHRVFDRAAQRHFAPQRTLDPVAGLDVEADLPQAGDQQRHQQQGHAAKHRHRHADADPVGGRLQPQPVPGRGEFDFMAQRAGPLGQLEFGRQHLAAEVDHTDLVFLPDPPRYLVVQQLAEAEGQPDAAGELLADIDRRHQVDQRFMIGQPVHIAVAWFGQPARHVQRVEQRVAPALVAALLRDIDKAADMPAHMTIGIQPLDAGDFGVFPDQQFRRGGKMAFRHVALGNLAADHAAPLFQRVEAQAECLFQPQDVLDQRVATLVFPVAPDRRAQQAEHQQQHAQRRRRQPDHAARIGQRERRAPAARFVLFRLLIACMGHGESIRPVATG